MLEIPSTLPLCDFLNAIMIPGSNAVPLSLCEKEKKGKGKEKHFHKSIYSTARDYESQHN